MNDMNELLKEKADELNRLIKKGNVLSEDSRLKEKMAIHAMNSYSDLELAHTTASFRSRLTGREE